MKKLRSGIKILNEIEGYGEPIRDRGRFDAVLKFYKNKGDPLEFNTILQDPIPYLIKDNETQQIGWHAPRTHLSNIVFEKYAWLARQADFIPGIYYSILGMKTMGFRHVVIPPHLFSRSMSPSFGLGIDSIVKVEIFIIKIWDFGPAI